MNNDWIHAHELHQHHVLCGPPADAGIIGAPPRADGAGPRIYASGAHAQDLAALRDFGLDDFYLELSTRPPGKAVGTDAEWDEATEALRQAASTKDLELVLDEGGGAFYGPKISVQAKDAIGRTWQMSTIQVDFQLPQRFELHYTGTDNARHQPIMIHRALFGSIERFFGILTEHYAGAFPAWLNRIADNNLRDAIKGLERGDILLRMNGHRLSYHGSWNDALREAMWNKWSGHRIDHADFVQPARSMSMIGG